MQKITILDFRNDKIIMRLVPRHLRGRDAEEIAAYFVDHIEDCEYMVGNCSMDIMFDLEMNKQKVS
jgi:hypothetical protein